MTKILMIGLGGALGAVCRYCAGAYVAKLCSTGFPLPTLLINFTGAFLIGFLTEYSSKITEFNPYLLSFLTIGLLGGFTTFSTFSLETVNLFENGHSLLAAGNVLLSVVLCLLGVLAGKGIVRAFV